MGISAERRFMVFEYRLRRPEYTGKARCWPCTIANIGILGGICVLLWAMLNWQSGAVLAVIGGVAIWLRGYLVPYTARVAPAVKWYLPFADESSDRTAAATGLVGAQPPAEELLKELLAAGVFDPYGDQLTLADEIQSRWQQEMASLRDASVGDLVASAAEITPDGTTVQPINESGTDYLVLKSADGSAADDVWLSRHIVIAEVAAVEVLERHLPDETARAAATPLRTFLRQCPICEAPLEETSVTCCGISLRGGELITGLVCQECDKTLLVFPPEA